MTFLHGLLIDATPFVSMALISWFAPEPKDDPGNFWKQGDGE